MALPEAGEAELRWGHDEGPRWDDDRRRLFAAVPEGVFGTQARRPGEPLSSDWWRVEKDGRVVGYGWLDDVWGDAEILLAVDGAARGRGIGGFFFGRRPAGGGGPRREDAGYHGPEGPPPGGGGAAGGPLPP